MKKYLLLAVLCIATQFAFGQALSTYGFTAFSGVYTPILGTTATLTGADGLGHVDNGYHSNIPIGFPFTYCGVSYTTISVNTNGWATLGQPGVSGFDMPDLSNALLSDAPRPILAPLWTDLYLNTAYQVTYQVLGAWPYRKFVIQWANAGYFSSTTPTESFQLILQESTNIIDFIYDSVSAGFYSSGFASIGITGGSGAAPIGLQPYWSLNDASASPTPSMSVETSTIPTQNPATNQVYQWTPPCGNALSPIYGSLAGCTGKTLTLTDTVAGGTWSVFSTSIATIGATTGVVTCGSVSGTDTIYYTSATGCVRKALLTVNPTPAAITGTNFVCRWDSTRLSDATPGGVWSSTNSSIDTVNDSGWVYGANVGVDSIVYTLPTGCYSTKIYSVNTMPTAITGPDTVCVNATATLSDPVVGGTWTSATLPVGTITGATGVVSGVTAGTTVISYTIGSCAVGAVVTVHPVPTAIFGLDSVCLGASTTLHDTTAGGTWSSLNNTIATVSGTGVAFGAAIGNDTIQYTLSTGCYAQLTYKVRVLPTAIVGSSHVCVGATDALTDPIAGGTWTTTNTTFATITGAGGVVTGVAMGVDTVSYTIGACAAGTVITVDSLPTPTFGTDSVCVGTFAVLGNTSPGGTWSSEHTAIATVNALGHVYGVSGGVDTISYTLTATGCYVLQSFTVNAMPAITGRNTVCIGDTIMMGDVSSGGTWSSSNNSRATVTPGTGIVTGVAAGLDTISYTTSSGCVIIKQITVRNLPNAISGLSNFCLSGGNTTYTDISGAGTWSSSNSAIATINAATGVAGGVALGVDTITFTLTSTGCSITKSVSVDALPAAVTGTDTVCVGASVVLNDVDAGGTWTSSNNAVATVTSGGSVTGVSAVVAGGVATITYTLGTGCTATYPITVLATPNAIGGPSTVCVTQGSVTETEVSTGGTWSSSNPAIANITGGGVVTGPGPGSGTVTLSYTNPVTGCAATKSFTVNPLPSAISGSTTVCNGANISLTDPTGGGSWSSQSPAIATVGAGTGVAGGVALGTTNITYTLPTGCYTTQSETVNLSASPITGATFQVCVGSTITLSDATLGGTWSASSGLATVSGGIVGGVSAGTLTITYNAPSGCSATAIVTVNPLPNAITGSPTVCVGGNVVLTETTGGGTWSSSTPGSATVAGGTIGGVAVGTTTITYTLPTGCYVTKPETVNAAAAAITGSTFQVCVGSTITLSDPTPGGTWSTSSGLATVSASGVVGGVAAGTVTITCSTPSGCTATALVTVNPLPAPIGGPNTVCLGATVIETEATGGGTWSSSAPGTATIVGGTLGGASIGTTTIVYTLPTGCSISKSITVNPNPNPTTGTNNVCVGSLIAVSNTTPGGTWSSSNNGIATVDATGTVGGVAAGNDSIIYTLPTTCFATFPITVNPLPASLITPIGDTLLCPGGFVHLTANTGVGYVYQWFNSGVFISGATTSGYIATTPGAYSVYEVTTHGCAATSPLMHVIIDTPHASIATPAATSFCTGTTETLYANTGAGLTYQWSIGGAIIPLANADTYLVASGGTYMVTVTNAAGCIATASVTMTTIPAPSAVVTTSGTLSFCVGGSVDLSVASGASSYQWYKGGVVIPGATTDLYTATTTGTYYVTDSNSSGCGATSSSYVVTVNNYPVADIAAAGPTTFCSGGNVLLFVTAVAGDTYQWYQAGTPIAGATSSTYSATTSGNYSIIVTSAGSCSTTSSIINVVVVSSPTVLPLSPTSFCWGSSAVLGVDIIGGTGISYQWQEGGTNIPGATNSTYTVWASGTYSCQLAIAGSCATTTVVAMTITEYPLPNPVITWANPYLTAQNYFVSYQWYSDSTVIPGATNYRYVPTGNGNYKVAVTDTNGCQSVADVYILSTYTGSTAGVAAVQGSDNGISIYPNPTHTIVNIASTEALRAALVGVDGRTIINQEAATTIDLSHLSNGTYMLMLYNNSGQMVKAEKVVKCSE
jgi:trimeric autotransporter adhesin